VFLLIALTTLAIGATIAAIKIDKSRSRAVAAEKDAREQLYAALLAQARASRMTGQAGHRIEALAAIQKAAAIHPSLELRNEAIAALTLVDLKVAKTLKVREKLSQRMACDTLFRTVAVATDSGDINVLSLDDGSVQKMITGVNQPVLSLVHSGARYLAARCVNDTIYLYDSESGRMISEFQNRRIPRKIEYNATDFSFSHDEKLISLSTPEGIEIQETGTGREVARIKTIQPEQCAFSPDGKLLAFAIDPRLKDPKFRIWNFTDGQSPAEVEASAPPTAFAWSFDNQYLAVGCADYSIHIFRRSDWQRIGTLHGHRQSILKLAFNHANDMLVSNSAEYGIRLWDLRTMTELAELPGYSSEFGLGFSHDDQCIYANHDSTLCTIEVVGLSRVCTAFTPPSTDNEQIQRYSSIEFSPDSRLVAKASINSVQIFDAKKARLLTTIPLPKQTQTGLRFLADNQTLVVLSRRTGITLYHYKFSNDLFEIIAVENHSQWLSYAFGSTSYNYSPNFCLNSDKETKGVVIDISTGKTLCSVNVRPEIQDLALSPNAKWLVVTEQNFPATVYDFPSGQKITELPDIRGGPIVFSPSGHWMGAPGTKSNLLWDPSTWKPGPALPAKIEAQTGDLAFAFDEKLLAARVSDRIELISLPANELLGSLEQQIIPNPMSRLRFSPDSTQLASHGMDNSLVLWSFTELKRELHNLNLSW
jgi:WD40 repeat protein